MNAKKRSTKKLTIKESYSDIWSDNAWDAYDIALEYLGAEGLCEALAKAMGTDALADNLKYIFRTNEIPFDEDDEEYDEDEDFDESCGRKSKSGKKKKKGTRKLKEGSNFDNVTDAIDYYYGKWLYDDISYNEIEDELDRLGHSERFIDAVLDGITQLYDDQERYDYEHDYYDESAKRPVKETIDIDADGYEYVTGRPGYHLYRKDLRDENGRVSKCVWAAQKYDAMKGQTVGEPFEITYDQARGFEPIEDTVASRLGKKVGKALGFPIRREALYNRFSDPSYNDDVAQFFFDNKDEIKKIATKNGFGWVYAPFKGRDGDNLVDVEGTSRSDLNAFEKDLRRFVKKFGIDFYIQELANTTLPLGSIRINFYK